MIKLHVSNLKERSLSFLSAFSFHRFVKIILLFRRFDSFVLEKEREENEFISAIFDELNEFYFISAIFGELNGFHFISGIFGELNGFTSTVIIFKET